MPRPTRNHTPESMMSRFLPVTLALALSFALPAVAAEGTDSVSGNSSIVNGNAHFRAGGERRKGGGKSGDSSDSSSSDSKKKKDSSPAPKAAKKPSGGKSGGQNPAAGTKAPARGDEAPARRDERPAAERSERAPTTPDSGRTRDETRPDPRADAVTPSTHHARPGLDPDSARREPGERRSTEESAAEPGARPVRTWQPGMPRTAPVQANGVSRTLRPNRDGRVVPADSDRAGGAARTAVVGPRTFRDTRPGARRETGAEAGGGASGRRGAESGAQERRGADPERERHAAGTARGHRSARHESAHAYHRNYPRHRPAHRWYQPRGWYDPWYPGYPTYWYHGVFVYGPSPMYHHDHVVVVHESYDDNAPPPVRHAPPPPDRAVDHDGDVSVGVQAGSYMSGYANGASYGDGGVGITARYRADEALGLEVSWMQHDPSWTSDSERVQRPLSVSVQTYAVPWTKVSPYLEAGLTFTGRSVNDNVGGELVEANNTLWGPNLGLGVEFALGKDHALNLEAGWVGYVNGGSGVANASAVTTSIGLQTYF